MTDSAAPPPPDGTDGPAAPVEPAASAAAPAPVEPAASAAAPAPVEPAASAAVPTATYRLQLQPDFPFAAAEAVVPHLAALGVSHLHLSPVLQAVPGSSHGYDVVDHTQVRE